MKTNMKLTAVFNPEEDGGYTAYIEEIPGVNTQGNNLEDTKNNLLEALEMVVEVRREIAAKEILLASRELSRHKIITEEIFLGT